jgi:biopolymer transport protein ExbB
MTNNNLRGWLVAALMAFATVAFAQAPAQPPATTPPAAGAEAPKPPPPVAATDKETVENPYGLEALWKQGDFV